MKLQPADVCIASKPPGRGRKRSFDIRLSNLEYGIIHQVFWYSGGKMKRKIVLCLIITRMSFHAAFADGTELPHASDSIQVLNQDNLK